MVSETVGRDACGVAVYYKGGPHISKSYLKYRKIMVGLREALPPNTPKASH
jgi:hypothetical protein